MTWNKLRIAAVAATLSLAVAGCGGDSGGTDTEPGATTGSTGAPPVGDAGLVIWTDDLQAPAVQSAADKFGADNGITVQVESIAEELQTQFVTAAQAGSGPDIVMGAHDWIGNLVQNSTIDPIQMTDERKAEFNPLAVDALTFNGQLYGVPYAIENIVLYRNTDIAPDAPATIEDLVATGQAAVDSGDATEVLAIPVGDNGDPYHMYPLYTSAGGYLFGRDAEGGYDPTDLGLADPSAATAMAKIAELGSTGSNVLKTSINGDNALALFTEGNAPYLISGPWNLPQIDESGIPYEISAIPGFEGLGPARPFIGAYGMYVASGGKNKSIAQEFATNFWATNENAVAYFNLTKRAPALLSAYDEVAPDNPNMVAIIDAGKEGDPMPAIPEMAAIWTPFGIAEAAVLSGEDPTASTQAAATAVQDAIG